MPGAPLYVLRPNIRRVLLLDIIKTLLLCTVFYAAIKINIQLFIKYRLLHKVLPDYAYILILVTLGILLVVEVLNTYRKNATITYDFYPDRIEAYGPKHWSMPYIQLQEVHVKKLPLIDSIFGTGTIILGPKTKLENISYIDQMVPYIQQIKQQFAGYAQQGYGQQQTNTQ